MDNGMDNETADITKSGKEFLGRTALITGSCRGIGKAIALALAARGAQVIIHGHAASPQLDETVAAARSLGAQAFALTADLSEEGAPDRLFRGAEACAGKIDILILNASQQISRGWLAVTEEEFARQMRVNVWSSFRLMQLCAPPMAARGWGRIVTLGSVQQTRPRPYLMTYAASKAAQMSIVKNLARILAPDGVTVNNLAPGVIDTDRNREALGDDKRLAQLLDGIPAGRVGTPEDCVAAALALCSAGGAYMTGCDIAVDGGMGL